MGDSSDQWHWWQHGEQIAKSTISWKQKERRRSAESKITAFSRNFNFSTKKHKKCNWLVSYWLSAWETRPEHPKDTKNKVKRPKGLPSRIRGPILCKLMFDVESDKIETLAATGHLCLLCRIWWQSYSYWQINNSRLSVSAGLALSLTRLHSPQ